MREGVSPVQGRIPGAGGPQRGHRTCGRLAVGEKYRRGQHSPAWHMHLPPTSAPSPSDTGPRPASGLPSCPAAAAASTPTPRGRLLSQAQTVLPAASSESLPQLISFSSLPLSLSLSLSLSLRCHPLLPSQAHPSSLSLSLSFCVSERGGGWRGRRASGCGVGSH